MSELKSKEHHDLIDVFEKDYQHERTDKESKDLWVKGKVYQDCRVNDLFLAYRRGYAYGKWSAL